ncbi:MAG: hypothetical protein ACXVA9_05730, partial [Bdellovibrionales bacterium]
MRLLDVRPLILLSVLAIAVAGCTRKTSDNATVRLSFENGSGQTKAVNAMDESIQVVILNITGSGISAPVFFQWDSHGATGAAFPETITLSVPRGDSRLIQALVVKKDLAGLNTFYYNDVTQSIQGDNTDVTLTVVPLSTTASAGDASIAGRYLDANGTGPTSKIRVYLPIPNHPEKPQMLVDNSQEMIGGWFRVFSLDGARFQYLLADGRDLFGSPVGVDSDSLLGIDADSPRTMRVSVPSYYSTNGDITSPRRLQGASRSVYGFFGPGAANLAKQISYCGSTHPIAYAYIDATSNTTLRWNPAQASYVAATDAFIETVGTKRGGATGSAADANGLCAGTGLPFLDYLALADQQLTSHDQVLGFKGPFQIQYGGGQGYGNTITTSVAAGVLSAKVVFLPGTQTSNTAKGIDGVDLFGRIETGPQTNNDNADYKDNNDGVRCATLDHLASPFTYLDTKNANPDPNALTVQALDVTLTTSVAAFVAATQVTYIACPFLKTAAGEKIYFSSAAVAQ